jgi:hypothetical protein
MDGEINEYKSKTANGKPRSLPADHLRATAERTGHTGWRMDRRIMATAKEEAKFGEQADRSQSRP